MEGFFFAIKALYGTRTKAIARLRIDDGSTLLTEKTQVLQRWVEHFRGVLNHPSTISDAAIARLPQVETNTDLDVPPALHETIRVVHQLSSAKEPGSDALVGHLRIPRIETGEPVFGAPTYTRRIHLHCPHCTRIFMHYMSLLGHMRIH
ncbi:hypothetical protein SprV_0802524100 [Sparganum proliferum]